MNVMQDQSSQVKATTTWTLGQIFETLHSPNCEYQVVTPANQQRIISVLLVAIRDAPKMAEMVCCAIYFLAKGSKDVASSILTLFPVEIISSLLWTTDCIDVGNSIIRFYGLRTLKEIVRCSPMPEMKNVIAHLLREIMNRLDLNVKL